METKAYPWVGVYRFFFLCLFLRKRFLRLCVAILWRFLFLPQGIVRTSNQEAMKEKCESSSVSCSMLKMLLEELRGILSVR